MAAGITDAVVDVKLLTDEEVDERATEIDRIVIEVMALKQATLTGEQLSALSDRLLTSPYTITQIQRAAEQVTGNDAARPLAWEHWQKAFATPTFSGQELQRMMDARRETRDTIRDEYRAEMQELLERQRTAIYEKGFEEGRERGLRETLDEDTVAAIDTLDELRDTICDLEDKLQESSTKLLQKDVDLLQAQADREDAWLKASAITMPSLEPRDVTCPNCRKPFQIQLSSLTDGHSRKGGRHGKAA